MPLHSKHSISKGINDEVFGSGTLSTPLPKYQFPENETAARDAVLQHRPARDGPRPIRAGRRAGRSGSAGVAVACALGQLGSRSRAYRHLPDCDLGVHRPRQVAGSDPVWWWATSRRSSSSACFHSNGGLSAAQHGRPNTNQMNLQPIATLFFGEGWSIGYSGNILADWNAPSEDVWTVPVGLGLGKVVKLGRLPVKIQLAVQYMPVHPRISGQEWNVQVQITPVIPKLIKGVLFQ